MELHELHVDDAGSGTVGHRLAIPASAKRIRIVRINLPEATGGKHGRTRHHLSHLTRPPVMEVSPHTGERSINLKAIHGVVAAGDEVNACLLRQEGDVWMFLQRLNQLDFDSLACCIRDVDDPRKRVSAFTGEGKRAAFNIKFDTEAVDQDIFKQPRAVFSKDFDSIRVRESSTCRQDVLCKALRRVFLTLKDNSTLGPERIAFRRVLAACSDDNRDTGIGET